MLLCLLTKPSRKWRFSISVLYGIIVAASLLFAAVYLGYYLLYNDTIRAENMLPILQTNKKKRLNLFQTASDYPSCFLPLSFCAALTGLFLLLP